MYCIKCGTELPYDAVFCKKCGQEVKSAVSIVAHKDSYQQSQNKQQSPHRSVTSDKNHVENITQSNQTVNASLKTPPALRLAGILGIAALIVLFSILSLNPKTKLVGTWEKTSGTLYVIGFWEEHDSEEGESASLVFKSNDFYIVTDGDGYVYTDSYAIVDENHIIMNCDNEKNNYFYSIHGNMLVIQGEYNSISYWERD